MIHHSLRMLRVNLLNLIKKSLLASACVRNTNDVVFLVSPSVRFAIRLTLCQKKIKKTQKQLFIHKQQASPMKRNAREKKLHEHVHVLE